MSANNAAKLSTYWKICAPASSRWHALTSRSQQSADGQKHAKFLRSRPSQQISRIAVYNNHGHEDDRDFDGLAQPRERTAARERRRLVRKACVDLDRCNPDRSDCTVPLGFAGLPVGRVDSGRCAGGRCVDMPQACEVAKPRRSGPLQPFFARARGHCHRSADRLVKTPIPAVFTSICAPETAVCAHDQCPRHGNLLIREQHRRKGS